MLFKSHSKPCCGHFLSTGQGMLPLIHSRYQRHSLVEMNACKSNQCFPLCNLPLHDLVSHQTPHLSTQLKSAELISILIKLSVQSVRTACKKPGVGLEQLVQHKLIVSLYFVPCGKGNFIPVRFTDWL